MTAEIVTTYHTFTDNLDDWFDTEAEARACIAQWKEDFGADINWRIYEERSERDGDMVDEDYLDGAGDFPW